MKYTIDQKCWEEWKPAIIKLFQHFSRTDKILQDLQEFQRTIRPMQWTHFPHMQTVLQCFVPNGEFTLHVVCEGNVIIGITMISVYQNIGTIWHHVCTKIPITVHPDFESNWIQDEAFRKETGFYRYRVLGIWPSMVEDIGRYTVDYTMSTHTMSSNWGMIKSLIVLQLQNLQQSSLIQRVKELEQLLRESQEALAEARRLHEQPRGPATAELNPSHLNNATADSIGPHGQEPKTLGIASSNSATAKGVLQSQLQRSQERCKAQRKELVALKKEMQDLVSQNAALREQFDDMRAILSDLAGQEPSTSEGNKRRRHSQLLEGEVQSEE
ncbi:hypothetical protein ACHAQA_009369 [Verticillium albo-atrum]